MWRYHKKIIFTQRTRTTYTITSQRDQYTSISTDLMETSTKPQRMQSIDYIWLSASCYNILI